IKNANMVLESIETKAFSEETKNRIIGEAKCMRAWSYFTLVQLYGDVPLRKTVVTSAEEVAIERSTEEEVYAFIFDDILDAEQKLPINSQQVGRVNKYVAKAILARIYLTSAGYPMNKKENYSKARDKALEVINSSEYKLMPTFDKVFKTERYTAETIWARLFDAPNTSSEMHTISAPIGSQTALCLPTDAFIASFDKGDMRKEWGIKLDYVNAKGKKVIARSYYNKYINEEYLEQDLPASNTSILPWQTQLIRLAEMYLIAAEAENEVNGPAAAYEYVNTIRQRARLDKNDQTAVPDLKNLTQQQFRDAVLLERQHELYEEGFAWFDMKRTQTFKKVQDARGDKLNAPIGAYNNNWLIPDFEIMNNNIPQNQEYR
ncbi:MAG: RagB/SusD family nutrient uptake outer membrane protein, partial [Tannerellaceae bacterium]